MHQSLECMLVLEKEAILTSSWGVDVNIARQLSVDSLSRHAVSVAEAVESCESRADLYYVSQAIQSDGSHADTVVTVEGGQTKRLQSAKQ